MNAVVGTIADQGMAQGVSRGRDHKREARAEVVHAEVATAPARSVMTAITEALAHSVMTTITEALAQAEG